MMTKKKVFTFSKCQKNLRIAQIFRGQGGHVPPSPMTLKPYAAQSLSVLFPDSRLQVQNNVDLHQQKLYSVILLIAKH